MKPTCFSPKSNDRQTWRIKSYCVTLFEVHRDSPTSIPHDDKKSIPDENLSSLWLANGRQCICLCVMRHHTGPRLGGPYHAGIGPCPTRPNPPSPYLSACNSASLIPADTEPATTGLSKDSNAATFQDTGPRDQRQRNRHHEQHRSPGRLGKAVRIPILDAAHHDHRGSSGHVRMPDLRSPPGQTHGRLGPVPGQPSRRGIHDP